MKMEASSAPLSFRDNDPRGMVVRLCGQLAGVDPSGIVDSTRFTEDLEFDSLDMVELAMKVEDELKVELPEPADGTIPVPATVGQFVEQVRQRLRDAHLPEHHP